MLVSSPHATRKEGGTLLLAAMQFIRKHSRRELHWPAFVQVDGNDTPCELVDLSERGAGVKVGTQIPPYAALSLRFEQLVGLPPVRGTAVSVKREAATYRIGIAFAQVSE